MMYTLQGFIWRVRVLRHLGFTRVQRREAFWFLCGEKWQRVAK